MEKKEKEKRGEGERGEGREEKKTRMRMESKRHHSADHSILDFLVYFQTKKNNQTETPPALSVLFLEKHKQQTLKEILFNQQLMSLRLFTGVSFSHPTLVPQLGAQTSSRNTELNIRNLTNLGDSWLCATPSLPPTRVLYDLTPRPCFSMQAGSLPLQLTDACEHTAVTA